MAEYNLVFQIVPLRHNFEKSAFKKNKRDYFNVFYDIMTCNLLEKFYCNQDEVCC